MTCFRHIPTYFRLFALRRNIGNVTAKERLADCWKSGEYEGCGNAQGLSGASTEMGEYLIPGKLFLPYQMLDLAAYGFPLSFLHQVFQQYEKRDVPGLGVEAESLKQFESGHVGKHET